MDVEEGAISQYVPSIIQSHTMYPNTSAIDPCRVPVLARQENGREDQSICDLIGRSLLASANCQDVVHFWLSPESCEWALVLWP